MQFKLLWAASVHVYRPRRRGCLMAYPGWLMGVQLMHFSTACAVQIQDCEGWWMSACHSNGGSRGNSMDSMETVFWRTAFENTIHKHTSIDLYVYQTIFQERPVSQPPICFKSPLLYSTTMCLPQLAAITIVLTNTWKCTSRKIIFVLTLQNT